MLQSQTTSDTVESTILLEAEKTALQPCKGDLVSVHYVGYLMNSDGSTGKEFDSSIKRGKPLEFAVGVGYVIKGWDMALLQMKKGEKRRIVIPPVLGYGSRGVPGVIPADATLIFEVELLDIKTPKSCC